MKDIISDTNIIIQPALLYFLCLSDKEDYLLINRRQSYVK